MTAEEYVDHMPGFIKEKVRELIKEDETVSDTDIFWGKAISMYKKANKEDPEGYPI